MSERGGLGLGGGLPLLLASLQFNEWGLLFFCVAPFVSFIFSPLAFKRLEASKLAAQQQRADHSSDVLERVAILQSTHEHSAHVVQIDLRGLRAEMRSLSSELAELREPRPPPKPAPDVVRAPAPAKPVPDGGRTPDVGRARSPAARPITRPGSGSSILARGANAPNSGNARVARAPSPARTWSRTGNN
jgi:hypothetical protein